MEFDHKGRNAHKAKRELQRGEVINSPRSLFIRTPIHKQVIPSQSADWRGNPLQICRNFLNAMEIATPV